MSSEAKTTPDPKLKALATLKISSSLTPALIQTLILFQQHALGKITVKVNLANWKDWDFLLPSESVHAYLDTNTKNWVIEKTKSGNASDKNHMWNVQRQTILMYGDGCGQDMNAKAMKSIQMLSRLNSAGQMKTRENESDRNVASIRWQEVSMHSIDFVWGKNIANKSVGKVTSSYWRGRRELLNYTF